MSASGEPPADEDPGVADPDNNDDNDIPDNISNADTEPAMLDEEEMPTYMSLTSVTSSSRLEESRAEVEIQQHPATMEAGEEKPAAMAAYTTDDHGGDCVYLSSGDESEKRSFEYDDEDNYLSDYDVEEEEDEDDDDDSRPISHDDDDSRPDTRDDEDSDAEIEQFERSSDDFVLQYDTTGLEKHHKVRSRSLQDLTNSRSNRSRFVGKRRSIDIMDNYATEYSIQNPETLRDPLGDCKKIAPSKRYAAVGSKVKLYIQQIKDQSRRSAERKNHESANPKNFNEAEAAANVDVSCTRLNPANRLIKDYVQNAMKHMIVGIPEEAKDTIDREMRLEAEIIPELQPNIPNNLSKNVNPEKSNGLIDYSIQNHTERNVEPMETCTLNGQPQISGILNLRSLSYEEYTNGDETPENKIETEKIQIETEKNGVPEYMEEQEVIGTTETETARVPTSLKTETAKIEETLPEEAQGVRESSDFPKSASHEIQSSNRESTDVPMLWAMLNQKTAQLNEKTAQYDGIRDAFQKTLSENISLKREMGELKKALAKYQKENEPREMKVASVQTETIPEEPSVIPNSETKPPMPKLMSTSIASTLSSFEQWSDSNCSPAISINPPNIDNVLNSDDSFVGATPRKSARQLSQSFVTSSRILQTLSNITQGRTRAASYIAKNADLRVEQGQSKQDSNSPFISGNNETTPARSKKRKASDMTSPSEYEQSFKIPFTPGQPRRKINSDFKTDGERKTSRVGEAAAAGTSNDENSERLPDDFEDTGATDVPDNVKCYVYQEEKDSKERSFLIQAEDTPENSQIGDKAGTARECGPYLLGNVEIRMTQANGTINIWGKEVSQSTENMTADEEMDESEVQDKPSTSRRNSSDSQKTPRCKFANSSSPFVCSTNKKSRDANFSRSGISKYFRPAFANLARATGGIADEGIPGHYRSSPVLNNRTYSCYHCESHKKSHRFEWPNCDFGGNSQRKQHSCCIHGVEANVRECDCGRDYDLDVFDDAVYETMSDVLESRKQCDASCHNLSTKHSCAEGTRRHQSTHNRHSPECEADHHHPKKRRSSCTGDIPACDQRLTPGNLSCRDNRSWSHSRHESCDNDENPLISNGQHYETPETKRRRLSGKKVRGILTDLLRGCGGCRDPKNISYAGMETSSLPNLNPSVRVTPCTPPSHPSCSKSSTNQHTHSKQPPRDLPNENGCSSCARRAVMTAEIESKLEILTVEMERLRSRSDTFRGMLDLLNSETD